MSDVPGAAHGPAEHHQRPPGVSDETVNAVGKLSEALESVERARGHLYSFHQLTGSADLAMGEAVKELRRAGHSGLADRIDTQLVGRNVLFGRWTFEVVEEYDDGYYRCFKDFDKAARDELLAGRRHVFEAEMKAERRSVGEEGD